MFLLLVGTLQHKEQMEKLKGCSLLSSLKANGKTIPAWGFRQFSVCFSRQIFEFDFLLAVVTTPFIWHGFPYKIWSFHHHRYEQALHQSIEKCR
jgi:hypothetical protein